MGSGRLLPSKVDRQYELSTDSIPTLKGPGHDCVLPFTLVGSPFWVSHIHTTSPSLYFLILYLVVPWTTLVYCAEGRGWAFAVNTSYWDG